MAASLEHKTVKTMAKALDARSFDPDYFAAMMNGESIEVQKAYFNCFMRSMHIWATRDNVWPGHPLYAVVQYAMRFAEDLPEKVD